MFFSSPIKYQEPLFRPPSEADSLIFQITLGCSWNKCSFCEMYTSKIFKVKKEDAIIKEIEIASKNYSDVRKVFLADGNPMVLSTNKLLFVLNEIKNKLPKVRRVSTYALPNDISSKSINELKELKDAGLKQLYIGIESGDDDVLKMINKSETYSSTVEGLLKAKEAGMKLSVIILNALGGKTFSEQHAINSAKILNEVQPEFASALTLSFPFGLEHFKKRFIGNYIPMNIPEILEELKIFISHTELEGTIFRSNHASNYLVLEGILGRDKQRFIDEINFALNNPQLANLREEWQRGL